MKYLRTFNVGDKETGLVYRTLRARSLEDAKAQVEFEEGPGLDVWAA